MAIISCPECGKQISDRAISCPDCGCPINQAPAIANQTDVSKEVEQLLVLARRSRESSDSTNAKKYYDQILTKAPGNWEAIFYSVYFEAMTCKIMHISSAANSVANSIYSTFAAIGDLDDEDEKTKAIDDVISSALTIGLMFVSSAVSHYNQFSTTNNAFSECVNRVVAVASIYIEIEESMKKVFPDRKERTAQHQKIYSTFLVSNIKWFNREYVAKTLNTLGEEIRTVDPTFQTPELPAAPTSGCYVATAVYGSYDCPEVWTLRRYRDNTLAESIFGRAFIHTYYAISPTLVKWFGKTQWFKTLFKGKLDKMVKSLNEKGFEDTPYEDKNWK